MNITQFYMYHKADLKALYKQRGFNPAKSWKAEPVALPDKSLAIRFTEERCTYVYRLTSKERALIAKDARRRIYAIGCNKNTAPYAPPPAVLAAYNLLVQQKAVYITPIALQHAVENDLAYATPLTRFMLKLCACAIQAYNR